MVASCGGHIMELMQLLPGLLFCDGKECCFEGIDG